jgi:outer membrane protein OmpA-like peptidoglycan-associated protein
MRTLSSSFVRIFCAALLFCVFSPLYAERFVFKYTVGDKYRVLSTVQQDVYVNRVFSHRAEILNRIAVSVQEARNGSGTLEAVFQTSEKAVAAGGGGYQWAREYTSIFTRDSLGHYDIKPEYWMPVVRDVPIFPDRELKPGDTWSQAGEEAHDFRDGFGLPEPYRIPFTANYRYRENITKDGVELAVLEVSYRIFDEPPAPAKRGQLWPIRIMGASDQTVYWDFSQGQPVEYEESFRFVMELSNGGIFEFRGVASSKVLESETMDRDRVAREIDRDIRDQGIQDTSVRVSEDGVVINLEDIKFRADSAELLPGELDKLRRLSAILKRYPDRDILVAGHTALAGTEEGRQSLSRQRAAAVADFLVKDGARREEQVVIRGFGATKPVASNASEAGMRQNRRVELILLEN